MSQNQQLTGDHTNLLLKSSPLFNNAVNTGEEELQNFLKQDIPIKFDWANRWLKGEEYAHILSRIDSYCKTFDLEKFSPKSHPESIYT